MATYTRSKKMIKAYLDPKGPTGHPYFGVGPVSVLPTRLRVATKPRFGRLVMIAVCNAVNKPIKGIVSAKS